MIVRTRAAGWLRPAELVDIIEEKENGSEFDSSAINQQDESVIFGPVKASKITPLVANPGRLLLTDRFLYFQVRFTHRFSLLFY